MLQLCGGLVAAASRIRGVTLTIGWLPRGSRSIVTRLLRTVAHFWTTARALRSLLPLRCSFIVQVAQGHTCWVCPGLYLLAHYVICYAGFICSREVRGTGRFRDHLPMFIRRSPSHTSGHPILVCPHNNDIIRPLPLTSRYRITVCATASGYANRIPSQLFSEDRTTDLLCSNWPVSAHVAV